MGLGREQKAAEIVRIGPLICIIVISNFEWAGTDSATLTSRYTSLTGVNKPRWSGQIEFEEVTGLLPGLR